ncbi:desmoglein-4 [Bombina bombina]|uniref:desmoglein-4 n=1 Tax=Bombina bombina TaxID=8345 RepID=UPI00235B1E35|nr:desmoglein-4 [Bombina bombina]
MDWLLCAKFTAFFILLVSLQCSCEWQIQANSGKDEKGKIIWKPLQLKRQKREWVVPPVHMGEEQDNTKRNPIAKVRSDIEIKQRITYTVSGPGVDRAPFGVFLINPRTGDLNVTAARIDREQIPMFYLTVRALNPNGGDVEKPLELRVRVMDINDNAPVFLQSIFVGSIAERSSANSIVMQITATDADEENTINSKIAYKIVSQDPSDPVMFIMNKYTGQVFTMTSTIDRETQSSYRIMVSGTDLDGNAGGQSGSCEADIKILDVNDNFPVLEYESYSVQIEENTLNDQLLIMKVFDADEMYSDNWIAVIEFVSGNEGGWFVTETNTQTNEVYLKVVKELDYEAMQSMNLGIVVVNRAAFHHSVISEYRAQMSTINVIVGNQMEGPSFQPNTQYITLPDGINRDDLISRILAKFTAIDMETGKPATNIVYMKGQDTENWLIIDSVTGEIKAINMLTADSPGVKNGTYTAEILAINPDLPDRTATATLVVNVPEGKAGCPTITVEKRPVCLDSRQVYITALNSDPATNAAPFTFELVSISPQTTGWTLQSFNSTTALLTGPSSLTASNITADIIVRDRNNVSCLNPWKIPLEVCECTDGRVCDAAKRASKNISLGPAAIGLMVLGFLALLLAPLLMLLCLCGPGAGTGFVPVAEGYDGACRPWGTEGAKPEDVDVTNMLISSGPEYSDFHNNYAVGAGQDLSAMGGAAAGGALAAAAGGAIIGGAGRGGTMREMTVYNGAGYGGGFSGESNMAGSVLGALPPSYKEGGAVNMAFVENYFAEKADAYANEDDSRPANDCLLIYDNEGVGSPAGSIGCCSFIADDLDDSYLDTLGSKFKTLAEICTGAEIEPTRIGDDQPRLIAPSTSVDNEISVRLDESYLNVNAAPPANVGSSNYISESSYSSSSNLQPARPITESFIPGNVVVTETYTTTESPFNPVVRAVEPRPHSNILVTERVVGSASGMQGGFPDVYDGSNVIVTERVVRPTSAMQGGFSDVYDGSNVFVTERVVGPTSAMQGGFSDVYDGSNVYVTERVVRPASGMQEILDFQNLAEGSSVVLRERTMTPSGSRQSNSLNIADCVDAQNVVVTERVIQPMSNVQVNRSHQDLGGGQNVIVTEKRVVSSPGMKRHMLSAEPLLQQSIASTSPTLARSKVTKYSTVQYTKK